LHTIPLIVSFVASLLVVPTVVRGLAEAGFTRHNYRGREVPVPTGIAIPLCAFVALGVAAPLDRLVDDDVLGGVGLSVILLYVVGVCLLGTIDDLVGTPAIEGNLGRRDPRGWRGHARATLRGGFSTGAMKAIGALGLAAYAVGVIVDPWDQYLLGIALVVLTTNLFNLLDLRPGRALKVFAVVIAALAVGAWQIGPLWTFGVVLGPLPLLARYDLAELGMLGDAGSNVLGAIAGLWMVLVMSPLAQAIALGVVLLATLYGEFRSISELIDRTPVLRFLDSIGRSQDAT
jgi:UDP-N-acetylmuramyl pentapeptide phosphotransferase/UDP-N-acetylglucosamine-1-phosphate transferase